MTTRTLKGLWVGLMAVQWPQIPSQPTLSIPVDPDYHISATSLLLDQKEQTTDY